MKNLNLIKRLWTDSHEKQSPQRFIRYAAMLIMLLTLGVGQMWGVNYNTFSAGDVLFYDFSDVTGNGGTNWHTGKEMMYDASGAGSVKCVIFTSSITMTTDWLIAKTAKGSWAEIKFKNRTNSAHNCIKVNAAGNGYTWTTHTKTVAEYVASGDYIMVYGGELSTWGDNQYKYRFMSANNADNTKGGGHSALSKSINGTSYSFGAALLTSGTYYQGHWNSGLSCTIEAGAAYVVRGTASLSSDYYSSAKATSGANSLYQIKKQSSTPTTSLTPTCSSSITEGEKLSFTPGSAGVSVLGNDNSIKYYLKNGSTYTEKTLSDGKIDVSDLEAGDYSIITLLYDGYIYVKASTSNFSVTPASTATLTYHANWYTTGTSGSVPAAQVVAKDGTARVAGRNTLAMTNYTFSGWNTEEYITGDHYDAGDDITMNDNINLYAEWTRSIPMDDQDATTPVSTTVYGTYNCTTITAHDNPEKTGYTFGGWYSQVAGAGSYVISPEHVLQANMNHWTDAGGRFTRYPSSTSSLYAKWTQSVTLKVNTDNHGSGTDKTATATWNKGTVSIGTHCSPATGYQLDGYYTAATGGTKILNANGSFAGTEITNYITSGKWTKAGATTLWAQYTPKSYTITFAPNGGSVTPTSRSVTYDAAIENAPIPTKTGYDFTGYNTAGGVSITTNAGVFKASVDGFTDASAHWIKASGATITAQWTAKQTTVTLDLQSGSDGDEEVTATFDAAMPSATMPTRLGYTFGGYYTNTGGAGTQYYTSGGASANNWNFEDATKTLYAKWTATTYTITYNLNGGANPGGVATSFTIESALITLPTPSRTGYTFGGWYGNSSFTGSAITTIAAGSTGNKEYWAKWTPKNYSITYDPVSAPEGVTYTTTPANANCDATVDMVFTPTGDNTVIVSVVDGSSNPVAVTNPSANTYRFTMPASDVTVSVSVQSLPIVYVLKTKNASAYIPFGFTSGGSADQVKIWAWKASDDTNFYSGDYPGQSASSKASEYTDAHGNVWWRFIPENGGFTRSTPFKLILVYHNGGTQNKIYESNGTHYISDGVTRTSYNSSTNDSFTGTVWVVPGGNSVNTATLYYENPSSPKKFVFVQGRFKAYTDKSRTAAIYTGSKEGDWSEGSLNIRMLYDETNSRYYLHTYCTPNELTSIKGNPGFINLRTSSVVNNFTDDSRYYLNTSGQNLTEAGQKRDFTETSTANRPYITATNTDKYVVLYWDESKLWYEEEPIPAQISSIGLSESKVPPGASITATPNMSVHGTVNQAYCWGVYTDAGCTIPVSGVSFNSLGAGKVQFTVPEAQATYYLKLTVHSSADCESEIDDEEVQSFQVTTSNMVFFNNSAVNWPSVYVYFLGDTKYWSDENKGSGCKDRDYGRANQMHRIGKSDIYFYEYSGNALGSNDVQFIAFTDYGKPNATDFAYVKAAYRGDFARGCAPMYVPENWVTDYLNYSKYYNRGYWTTYGVNGVSRNSGFTLKIFNAYDGGSQVASETLSNTDGSNTYRATVNLNNVNYSYGYQLLSCANNYYGNDGVMNAHVSSDWKFEPDKHRCGLDSKAAGAYTFIVQCTDGGEVRVSVEYPLMDGDYRLMYNDTCIYQAHAHPSQFIRQNYSDVTVKLDTVSMYIRPDKQPVLTIQRCTNASATPLPEWENVGTYDVSGLTNGHRVYNFYISQAVSSGALTINGVSPYTGLYYIRTQRADGGWTGYKTNSDNVMTYTEYAEQKNYGFNYYKAKWVGTTGADVTFTIANDYSESLCDTMVADPGNNPLTAAEARSLPHTASVRFGWNSLTNTLHRAYINGTSIVSDRYLVMIGDAKLKDKDGKALTTEGGGKVSGLNDYEMNFTDLNNWIYRCDVKAVTGAEVQLVGNYDGHTQHFIGTAEKPEEIIGGDSEEEYLMRVTYDFKTNRLMTAWLPDGDAITSDMTLNADMMLIREGQNAATQVYFGESAKDKKIDEIHSIYGVMQFNYSDIVGKFSSWSSPNAYKFLMYYVSFPFDVKVSEIFGAGVRGKNWIIQKYNGAKRAQIGWFAETSTFWETLPGDSILHANEGYMLILDRVSFNNGSSSIWTNLKDGNSVYLYFPSASRTVGTIKDDNEEVPIKIPSHTCIIERPFTPDIDGWSGGELVHSNTDSHWNVFGTPLFQSKAATTVGESELKYFYSWNYTDNTLRPRVTLTGDTVFKSMHGYMVQFAGNVIFTGAHISASVAARRMPSNKHYLAELQLVNENGDENATYVELRENANTDFQLNEDMYMMRSSNTVDLYSFAGAYDVAANVLPIDDQLVRVGVDVKRAGTYRFTMPSEFSGTVTLIDNLMGTRTNMALGDHEVYLERGVDNNRFLLEININKMPTAIDGVDGGSLKDGKAHKFIENGQMYILKDGIIYDARGARVK